MNDLATAREAVRSMGVTLLETGLVVGTWGNVSVRLGPQMVITPTGADYDKLTADDMPVVDLATGTWTGQKPSSERGLHLAVYRERPEIQAVIHAHSPFASTLAAAHRDLPPVLDDLAQIAGPGVRVAPYALPGTSKIVRVTMKALRGRMAAFMANHGVVCLGRSLDEAHLCCQVVEKAAKAFIEAEFLGGAKELNHFEAWAMHQIFLRKYSKQFRGSKA